MDKKICTNCEKELPATKDNFHVLKNGKYGLRSTCKPCTKIYIQKYRSTDAYKKKHRESMSKWRKENPDEALKVSRRSYKKNGKKHNEIRKEKYHSDENYRKQKLERDKKYTESGRRKELYIENRETELLRNKKYRENNPQKIKEYNDKYREENKDYLTELWKNKIKELHPSYIACSMRKSLKDLTPEVIETRKLIIKIKRELRNNNVKIR